MKIDIKTKVIVLMCLPILIWNCTGDFEAINENPNSPTEVPVTNHFADVIVNFSTWTMNPGVSSVMTQPNYVGGRLPAGQSTYGSTGEDWSDYYLELNNINAIISEAEKLGNTNMLAVALTFRSQMVHVATDMWRDMPYTEAAQATEGIIAPKYDTQEQIYPLIISDLKKAADLFNVGGTDQLGEGDILLGGDVAKWQKYCNSLRLRIGIRISDIDPSTSTSIIAEVLGNSTKYPVLESNSDNVELVWPGIASREDGFWYWTNLLNHEGAGKIVIDFLNQFDDPRLPIWFLPATTDGVFRGSERVGFTTEFVREDISTFNPIFGEDPANRPTGYFRYAEVCQLKAEIFERGIYGGDARVEYEKGIEAAMQQYKVASVDIQTYLGNVGVAWQGNSDDLTKIRIQKYLALFLMAQESWAEGNRTDVPIFPLATGSLYPDHNRGPFRMPYPLNEEALNSVNTKPFQKNIIDFYWGQQMWWDTRTWVK